MGTSCSWLFCQTDNLATLIGSVLLLVGLALNASQWRSEAASRRQQEFENRIERFQTPKTRTAISMILNYERDVQLREGEQPQKVTWEESEKALIPALYREYRYEGKLIEIRDCYNELLEGLSHLEYLMGQKLVHEADVDHIAKELLIRIGKGDTRLARNLRLYIQWRKSSGVLKLMERYDVDITRKTAADKADLERNIAEGKYGDCIPSPWGML